MQTNVIPERIQLDNGSEFISRDFDKWAYENKVSLDYSRPGKPTDKPFIESFNGSFRDECLKTYWFLPLEEAYEKIIAWVKDYNNFRPHNSLGQMTLVVFIYNQKHGGIEKEDLPVATLQKARCFATEEYASTATEYTYLSEEFLTPFSSPKSPT